MPLLMCPNCDGSMQAVQRAGVEFDMCPQCRGVWLDRGELEKLMAQEHAEASAKAERPPAARAPSHAPQPYAPGPERHDAPRRYKDDDDDDRHRYGQSGHPKKKRFDLFDIFD
ncbi:MAG: zf-TFIIB domain-containing protein [bacterium]|nr:zf-TFIIB domain-containing protein [Alphaproteobacteria bacterium]MDI1364258.1 zf-TFIIB domain-containing protein [bacterium]